MIKTKDADYVNNFKRSGLKNTKQRAAILNVLEQSDHPIAAEQVFLELKEKDISVNMSTVYRALEALAEKDIVTKLSIAGDNRTLFEYNRMVHRHYLVCLGCKSILAVGRCPLEDYEKSIAKETNYSIAGHKLDIYGYCPKCRENAKALGEINLTM